MCTYERTCDAPGLIHACADDLVADQQCIRDLLPVHDRADVRVAVIEVRRARVHREELRAAAVAPGVGDADRAGEERAARLGGSRESRAAEPARGRIAALHDEARHDAMELDAVVEAIARQLD